MARRVRGYAASVFLDCGINAPDKRVAALQRASASVVVNKMSDNIRRFERRKKQDGAPQITPAPDPSMPAFTSNDGMPDWANPSNGGLDDADMIPPRWMNRGMGSIAPSRDTQPGADAFPDPSEIVAPITRALETNLEILEVVRAEFLKAEERFQDSLRQIRGDVEQLKRSSTEQP